MFLLATSPFVSSLEHIMGFLVVLMALTLLWAMTALMGKLFIRMEAAAPLPAEAPAAATGASPTVRPDAQGPTEEEVVALTATVAALMGRRSRIVSIRSGAKDWHREGRREHFASHRIR